MALSAIKDGKPAGKETIAAIDEWEKADDLAKRLREALHAGTNSRSDEES